jgi:hypothetical protein
MTFFLKTGWWSTNFQTSFMVSQTSVQNDKFKIMISVGLSYIRKHVG